MIHPHHCSELRRLDAAKGDVKPEDARRCGLIQLVLYLQLLSFSILGKEFFFRDVKFYLGGFNMRSSWIYFPGWAGSN